MENTALAWIVAGLLAVAGVVALLRARSEAERVASLELQLEALEKELRASRAQKEKKAGAQLRKGDQDAELRRKLDKAKKRAAQAREAEKAEAERVKGLEGELALRQSDLQGLRAELERASAAPAPARAPAPVVRPVVVPKKRDPEEVARREAAAAQKKDEDIVAMEARVARAEAAAKSSADETAGHRKQMERLKGKHSTQELLYVSIRSELEAKKDRLRTQIEELERLRALKVALVDPLPVPAPMATESKSEEPAPDPSA
jgi:DNA repair exonuclease SbcCD ATPase subunit